MTLLEICQQLEATKLAEWVTQSEWGFRIMAGTHLMGLGLSVGTIVWMDLRLLGKTMRTCPVSEVYRRLAPWMLFGFAVMMISGVVLFVSYASAAYGNTFFAVKLGAILIAGVNAGIYHFLTERQIAQWDTAPRPPLVARMTGLISIGAWTVVVLAGRAMSYTMF